MYNSVHRGPSDDAPKLPGNIHYFSTLTLFKQQYSAEILQRRDQLWESMSHRDTLNAYNKAMKELHHALHVEHPDEYQALEETVEQLKLAQNQRFEEHPEDVKQA
jgi:hypothetical protein